MKKLSILIFVILFITPYFADAQRWRRYRYEIVGGLGTVSVLGDIGGGSGHAKHNTLDINMESIRPAIMLAGRYKLKELLSIRANFAMAYANVDDKYAGEESRINRGAKANIFLVEPSFQFEYSLIKERYGRRYTFSNIRRFNFNHVNTYLFAGIGGLLYFPNNEIKVDSGVGEPGVFTAVFPMGIGFKYAIDRVYTVGLEVGNRYSTSDYIDGFSDKFSTANDTYFFFMFTLSKRLRTSRKGLPRF